MSSRTIGGRQVISANDRSEDGLARSAYRFRTNAERTRTRPYNEQNVPSPLARGTIMPPKKNPQPTH